MSTATLPTPKRVNLRTPEIMQAVQRDVEKHYRSEIVEMLKATQAPLRVGPITIRLAKQFGFCYGVERAIDMAYAARKFFPDRKLFIVGEIIHNPEVNEQIAALGIRNLTSPRKEADIEDLNAEDVVILPAFGAETEVMERIQARGCQIVDTTCGDVMSVWRRVRKYAQEQVTSIIHGKSTHEETRATASRALGENRTGHYLVVLTLDDVDTVCRYITQGGDRATFLTRFQGCYSEGFDPELHLRRVGVANQTTMLRGETEEVQRRIEAAIRQRDGEEVRVKENFRFFDTICGATQERQDALREMLNEPMDLLFVVGGYNSSNTTHLAEMGEAVLPTYFIRNSACIESAEKIRHFDFHRGQEIHTSPWMSGKAEPTYGITAGASCPNNLIEETVLRLLDLHGLAKSDIRGLL